MKVALTKCERNLDKYENWLGHFGIDFDVLEYSNRNEPLESYAGLILTGGIDIYPELYNDWENSEDTGTFSPERDGFELKLIADALRLQMPVLGICRGCQLLNVFFRGSLIYDLEQIRGVNHKKLGDGTVRLHDVNVLDNSLLSEITGVNHGIVTSTHHQAVDRLGEGLIASAKSPDGIIEAVEYAERKDKSFLLGIQWHPELFAGFSSPFSENIILKFKRELHRNK